MSLNGSKSIEEIGLLNFDMPFLGLTSFQSSMGFGCGYDGKLSEQFKKYCEEADVTIL